MKLHYFPETDSLYVEFQERPSVDTRELTADIRLDLDAEGRPVGLDIDHASEILDLDTLETEGLPRQPANVAHGQTIGSAATSERETLAIEPARPSSLLKVLAALPPLDEEFPPIAEPHLDTVEL